MRKYIFKFWLLNLVFIAILFLVNYVVIFANVEVRKTIPVKFVVDMLIVSFHLYFTFAYCIVMIVFSSFLFLNLKKIIRTNFFLSLLSFIGMPLLALICVLIYFYPYYSFDVFWWIGFPLAYLLLIIYQFYRFRKRISKYE